MSYETKTKIVFGIKRTVWLLKLGETCLGLLLLGSDCSQERMRSKLNSLDSIPVYVSLWFTVEKIGGISCWFPLLTLYLSSTSCQVI